MAEFPDPESRNALEPGCSRCPKLAESRECISWGNGSLDADVMVVGEAPAFGNPDTEEWRGGNWTGLAYSSRHSGQQVRDLFADAGFSSRDLYFTNAVKCFPADEENPETNREPTPEERGNCRNLLVAEIEQVEPAVVATTGKHATLSVLDEQKLVDGFLDTVLDPLDVPAFESAILPLLHPSYQNVWLPQIGYSREEYVTAIGETVERVR